MPLFSLTFLYYLSQEEGSLKIINHNKELIAVIFFDFLGKNDIFFIYHGPIV